MKFLLLLLPVVALVATLFYIDQHYKGIDKTLVPVYELENHQISSDLEMQVVDPETGKLKVQGWAVYPNKLSYQPSLSKTYWPILSRDKQWNYFYVRNKNYLVTMAHANVGVVKSSYINVLKIGGDYDVTETLIEDYFGNYVFIDVNKNGNGIYSVVEHPDLTMKFIKPEGDTEVQINVNSKTDDHTISANLVGVNWSEGITHVENQTIDGDYHSFNTKMLVDFVGSVTLNGKNIMKCTSKNPCMGLHDNGRSVGKYTNVWVWGSLAFKVQGGKRGQTKKIGLNLSGSEATQNASGDAIWIDDKIYKLDSIVVDKVNDTTWTLKSYVSKGQKYPKNKIDLTFKVDAKHTISKNFIIIDIDFNSNFGIMSGTIESEDGQKIEFKDEFAFVEEMFSRW
ncbi:unnamed protein product [Moneuplotes crassus]|uniref:DUF2804 domain-containing protein n=1 Tax=Euplotes crassus TaxID=5936 RepID=A0AAD1UKX6_EUPCR|nr:unnamed protein product [Moneuplotes crassus]